MIPLDYVPRPPPRWRRLLRWLLRLLVQAAPSPLIALTPLDAGKRPSKAELRKVRRILEKMAREN